ncbi:hypothetical protein GRI42_00015 [Erythrobacter gaetbuli]|uniref:Uncharacterized protein n=1 Tax=Qipengyuania gaetbuli TaxID=266952 RepID=A0A844XXM3_9SPHN|nr:hypothetical protein [Qipengyuania gaetbuli]
MQHLINDVILRFSKARGAIGTYLQRKRSAYDANVRSRPPSQVTKFDIVVVGVIALFVLLSLLPEREISYDDLTQREKNELAVQQWEDYVEEWCATADEAPFDPNCR